MQPFLAKMQVFFESQPLLIWIVWDV